MRTRRWAAMLGLGAALAMGCGDDDGGTDVGVEADGDGGEGETTPEVGDDAGEGSDDADVWDEGPPEGGDDGGTGVCEEEFWIWDLSRMPPRDTQICASRRGEGVHAHVWVEDEQWGPSMDESGVTEILRRWDEETPPESVAPDQGIFEIVTGVLGDPPDAFDDDPKINILLYGMEPYGSISFDGYFRSDDQTASGTSNRREMIHINTLAGHRAASPYMIGVMAHEFCHMVQWNYDAAEASWLSEALSEAAMVLTGYLGDLPAAVSWARNPAESVLVDGVGNPVDYGAVFLLGTYLWDRLGADGLRGLLQDPTHGTGSVERAVQAVESGATFEGFFAEFALAVALDDPDFGDGRYGFPGLDLPAAGATRLTFPAATTEVSVPAGGIKIVRVALDGSAHAAIALSVDAGAGDLGVRAALLDATGEPRVEAVTPGTPVVFTAVPETATEIVVALATSEGLALRATVAAADE